MPIREQYNEHGIRHANDRLTLESASTSTAGAGATGSTAVVVSSTTSWGASVVAGCSASGAGAAVVLSAGADMMDWIKNSLWKEQRMACG